MTFWDITQADGKFFWNLSPLQPLNVGTTKGDNMKKFAIIAAPAILGLSLAACDSPAEEAAEDQMEAEAEVIDEQAELLEEKADAMEEAGNEAGAEATEAQAEALEDQADDM